MSWDSKIKIIVFCYCVFKMVHLMEPLFFPMNFVLPRTMHLEIWCLEVDHSCYVDHSMLSLLLKNGTVRHEWQILMLCRIGFNPESAEFLNIHFDMEWLDL